MAYFYSHFVIRAPIAQLVEQLPFKQMVAGSNPAGRTIPRLPFGSLLLKVCRLINLLLYQNLTQTIKYIIIKC